jgi:hypothetical protein
MARRPKRGPAVDAKRISALFSTPTPRTFHRECQGKPMTFYEHAMIGIDGALAVGLNRCYGWRIVALAGFAAVLPDWDGLTLMLGANC